MQLQHQLLSTEKHFFQRANKTTLILDETDIVTENDTVSSLNTLLYIEKIRIYRLSRFLSKNSKKLLHSYQIKSLDFNVVEIGFLNENLREQFW